jgi:hypothetical protein
MDHRNIVRRLSHVQREMLIAHIDGPRPVRMMPGPDSKNERRTARSLENFGLLSVKRTCEIRPRSTHLTDLGREVLAAVLANYAESLVRAGCLDDLAMLKLSPRELAEIRLMTTSAAALTEV